MSCANGPHPNNNVILSYGRSVYPTKILLLFMGSKVYSRKAGPKMRDLQGEY